MTKMPLILRLKLLFLSLLQKTKFFVRKYILLTKNRTAKTRRPLVKVDQILGALSEMGVKKGDSILIHSGISNIGKIEGGAIGLLDGLKKTIGDDGALLLPSFRFDGTMKSFLDNNQIVDLDSTTIKMGALSVRAKNDHGFEESVHPTHPVLAYGRCGLELISKHKFSSSPFDSFSPFYLLSEVSGKVVTIGVDLDKVTNFHVVEDKMADDFPVPTYLQKDYEVMILAEGREYNMKTKCHNPLLSLIRKCERFHDEFIANEIMLKTPIGNSYVAVIDSKKMNDYLEKMANLGYTIYGKV